MSSKEVYRDFIQQAANQQKTIILWDAQRQYAGRFKSFDSSGDYVILSDVTIVQPDTVMTVSEILLPLVSLKIVSSGQGEPLIQTAPGFRETVQPTLRVPTEPAGAPALPNAPEATIPSVPPSPEDGSPLLSTDGSALPPLPDTSQTSPEEPALEQEEIIPTIIQPLPEEEAGPSWGSDSKFFEEKPSIAGSPAEGAPLPGISFTPKPEVPKEEESLRIPSLEELMGIAPPVPAASPMVPPTITPQPSLSTSPVIPPVERVAPPLSPLAKPELEPEKLIEAQAPGELPKKTGLKALFSSLTGRFKKAPEPQTTAENMALSTPAAPAPPGETFKAAPVPQPQTPPPAGSSFAVRPSDFEVRGFEKPKPRIVPPEVLAQKSAEVSSSPFFQGYATAPGQYQQGGMAVPKKKRDISTIILDIVIALLFFAALAIVAMGFLKIKIPFRLPFF